MLDPQKKDDFRAANSGTHPQQERREFNRVCLKIKVEVIPMGGESIQGWTSDVSMGGWFVETEQELPVGTQCIVKFEGPNGTKIVATGRIVRRGTRGLGGELLHMDIESYCNLGRLIRLSSRSAAKVIKELRHLGIPALVVNPAPLSQGGRTLHCGNSPPPRGTSPRIRPSIP